MTTETLFEDSTPEERVKLLRDNALRVEEMTVKRYFTPEQMEDMRKELTADSIECSEKEDELKEVSAPLKAVIKEKKAVIKERLQKLKAKFEESREEVFLMDNQQDGMMEIYDAEGKLVSSRKLLPSERQTRIVSIPKQA